jgi:all-trans-retinol dehydrogenase (NAD+)
MQSIKGKKAIVTGGAMGIGLATARRLLSEGCDVTIWDVNGEALKQAEKELASLKAGKVFAYKCDVTDNKTVMKLARTAIDDMGRIDILINNAGIERHGRFCSKPLSEWELVLDVNLRSIFYTTHAILPHMYEKDFGYVVNISSAAGIIGVSDLAAYAATKWGVWGFTESLRYEAIADNKNVRFSSIHPIFLMEGLFAGGHLHPVGEFFIPRIKSHDVVAKAIVNKAIKKNRNTVKVPVTLHVGILVRALLPDKALTFLGAKVFGLGDSMADWVGRKK